MISADKVLCNKFISVAAVVVCMLCKLLKSGTVVVGVIMAQWFV